MRVVGIVHRGPGRKNLLVATVMAAVSRLRGGVILLAVHDWEVDAEWKQILGVAEQLGVLVKVLPNVEGSVGSGWSVIIEKYKAMRGEARSVYGVEWDGWLMLIGDDMVIGFEPSVLAGAKAVVKCAQPVGWPIHGRTGEFVDIFHVTRCETEMQVEFASGGVFVPDALVDGIVDVEGMNKGEDRVMWGELPCVYRGDLSVYHLSSPEIGTHFKYDGGNKVWEGDGW